MPYEALEGLIKVHSGYLSWMSPLDFNLIRTAWSNMWKGFDVPLE